MRKFEFSKDKPIKEIFKDTYESEDIPEKDRCHMHEWYIKLIDKSYDDLTLFDVTRMWTQKVYLELAVEKAKEFLSENSLCGEYYEGNLIERLSKTDVKYLESDRDFYYDIISKATWESDNYDWIDMEDKKEFEKTIYNSKIRIDKLFGGNK